MRYDPTRALDRNQGSTDSAVGYVGERYKKPRYTDLRAESVVIMCVDVAGVCDGGHTQRKIGIAGLVKISTFYWCDDV